MLCAMTWVLDLDGVVWLVDQPIPGAVEAIARLRGAGEQVAFVTNSSLATRTEVAAKLETMGIDPGEGGRDVVTSSMAVAGLMEPGERALVIGGRGIDEALECRDVEIVPHDIEAPAVDAVVVGLNMAFDYAMLRAAMRAVRGGARLLATNDDATYPTPSGLIPGGGSILASIVTASGVEPIIAGKPYAPITHMVLDRFGSEGVCVGDRPDTDGRFARALGYDFVLVLSGVTAREDLPVDPTPDAVHPDLAAAIAAIQRIGAD